MTDKTCVQQVLGTLLQHPQIISQVDKYNLTITDFSTGFEKYVFSAIVNLYRRGSTKISPIDVENYLDSDKVAEKVFKAKNGIEYLQDAEELSQIDSFPYYYDKLKKINLLNDLKKSGHDISPYYEEDITSPRALEVNANFEKLSIKDIIDSEKKKLLKLEADYDRSEEVQIESISEGIDEFVDELGGEDAVGLPIQGHIYSQVINGAERRALTIRSGASGTGKALPNSSLIPTPNGWKKVGEIQKNDYLFDAFGKPTRVLATYPQGKKRVVEVKFKDGRSVKCCEEHLWSYNTLGQKEQLKNDRKFFTSTTKEIMKKGLKKGEGWNILVPMQKAVEYAEQSHYLTPYTFGLLLGDGSFRQNNSNKSLQYSSEDDYLPKKIAEEMNWKLKKGSYNNFTWYFANQTSKGGHENIWVEDALCEFPELIGVYSCDKYIPKEYLEDSIANRRALLNGLLDSDGGVDVKGRVNFTTNSPKLRDGMLELCHGLGYKTSVFIDTHKSTSECYEIHITGTPEDKKKLFRLPRKLERIEAWYNSDARKENNTHNPIIDIVDLGYEEEMTCFYVDNQEHLFLAEDYVVTHNTRNAVADACTLAFPLRFNSELQKWEQVGNSRKVLFIITEQTFAQIRKMVLAYLTDINESRFKYKDFAPEEEIVIKEAKEVLKKYADNFIVVKMPNPTIDLIKSVVRENCLTREIEHVFYDYIFIGPALLNEFRGFNIRNDECLLMLATALKDLAVELDVSMMTSTQVNANADDNRNIRNEASLAGGRSTINKADNGAIMARPTKEELDALVPISEKYGTPNLVTDIYKVRSGEWTQIRIWSKANLGTMRRTDLFVTDANLEPIEGFFDECAVDINVWEDEEYTKLVEYIEELNKEVNK